MSAIEDVKENSAGKIYILRDCECTATVDLVAQKARIVYCRMHEKAPLMLKALKEITEGRGAYALDAFKHARNTIVDMKSIAVATLAEVEGTDG